MSRASRTSTLLVAAIAVLALCPGAEAADVTVGSPLTATFQAGALGPGSNATIVNVALPEAGAHLTSPVDGAVVSWTLLGAEGGPISLRVLRPEAGTTYKGVGTSAPATAAPFGGRQTFPTDLPIQAGDAVGIDVREGEMIAATPATLGAASAFWVPPLAETSAAWTIAQPGAEFAFDAEVQPAPRVTALGATSGPVAGGTAVTITGTDLEGATAVRFGSVPAGFSVDSEVQITTAAPPGAAGTVPVEVTTIAGTATAPQVFTYAAAPVPAPVVAPPPLARCVVPSLNGKMLKASKKKSRAAHCRIGTVTERKGVSARTGRVVKQVPKPGKVLAAGTKIRVKLG